MKKLLLAACILLGAVTVNAEFQYKVWREQVNFSHPQAMNSYGDYFNAQQFNSGLTSGGSTWILIDLSTATKNMYLNYEAFSSTGMYSVAIRYEPTVISSGTEISGNTFNRVTQKSSDIKLHGDDGNITANTGTVIDFTFVGGSNKYENIVPLVLEKGFAYVAVVKNQSNDNTTCEIKLYWFEK